MDEESWQKYLTYAANLIALVVAIAGIASQSVTFKPARPATPPIAESGNRAEDRKFARLWDDPFTVFKQPEKPPPEQFVSDDKTRTIVLCVLVKALDYFEDKESRLRTRYAVQTALAANGFFPDRSEVLTTLELDLHNQEDCGACTPVKIPCEDFSLGTLTKSLADPQHYKDPSFQRVRVAWINETAISPQDFRKLLDVLLVNLKKLSPPGQTPPLVLIGPSDSDSLKRLFVPRLPSEVCRQDSNGREPPLRVLSYRATVPASLLILSQIQKDPERDNESRSVTEVCNRERDQWVYQFEPAVEVGSPESRKYYPIERIGATDADLCSLLLQEIEARRPLLTGGQPKILVLHEQDTLYGTSIANTFKTKAEFEDSRGNPNRDDLLQRLGSASRKSQAYRVHLVGYLRGLDGFSSYYRNAFADPELGSATLGQLSEGPSQMDYLRKLTARLSKAASGAPGEQARPEVIAVFGSDVL